ncbi:MAG TPA: hypothetical protein VFL91_21605 [Thermomicrobiales bacterium]|nr:hypothetical protein [Thermomicrobiales bacterium]
MPAQPLILRHTYTRRRATARAALRYYQLRPRGEDEPPRAIFTKDGTLSRDEANRLLDEHQAGRFLAHRLMLSPPADERPDDLRELTRYVMAELEKRRELDLHWVAVEHRNTAHPHVHIVLCGGADAPGAADGARREVRLDRGDHRQIKDDGLAYCRLSARLRDDWDRALAGAAADDRAREAAHADRGDRDR